MGGCCAVELGVKHQNIIRYRSSKQLGVLSTYYNVLYNNYCYDVTNVTHMYSYS